MTEAIRFLRAIQDEIGDTKSVHFYVTGISDDASLIVRDLIDIACSLKRDGREVLLMTQLGWKRGRYIDKVRGHHIPILSPNKPVMGMALPIRKYLESYWLFDTPDMVITSNGYEALNGSIAAYNAGVKKIIYATDHQFDDVMKFVYGGEISRSTVVEAICCSDKVMMTNESYTRLSEESVLALKRAHMELYDDAKR